MVVPFSPSPSDEAATSLLSLSIAAANADPIPIHIQSAARENGSSAGAHSGGSLNGTTALAGQQPTSNNGNGGRHHRRLSSTGKARRRLSDARDAANRPSPALLQHSTTLSLTTLSLSSSPPRGSTTQFSSSFTAASNSLYNTLGSRRSNDTVGTSSPSDAGHSPSTEDNSKLANATPIPIGNGKSGRKRGVDHKCETCSKIYRHPSCLTKHRWEHTPHWREASKFVLSKHQQVQLLEAAAILSHLSPSSSSLPEDRSLWPSFLSGGSLVKAEDISLSSSTNSGTTSASHHLSSSVPAPGNIIRSTSSGPRLHTYSIPPSSMPAASGGITQLRSGLVGMSNGNGNDNGNAGGDATKSADGGFQFGGYRGAPSSSWASSSLVSQASYVSAARSPISFSHSDERSRGGGSGGGRSRRAGGWGSSSGSRSASEEDDESVDVEVEVDGEYGYGRGGSMYPGRYRYGVGRGAGWKVEEDEMSVGFSVREEDEDLVGGGGGGGGEERKKEGSAMEWDGLEMEMDMD